MIKIIKFLVLSILISTLNFGCYAYEASKGAKIIDENLEVSPGATKGGVNYYSKYKDFSKLKRSYSKKHQKSSHCKKHPAIPSLIKQVQ